MIKAITTVELRVPTQSNATVEEIFMRIQNAFAGKISDAVSAKIHISGVEEEHGQDTFVDLTARFSAGELVSVKTERERVKRGAAEDEETR